LSRKSAGFPARGKERNLAGAIANIVRRNQLTEWQTKVCPRDAKASHSLSRKSAGFFARGKECNPAGAIAQIVRRDQ